MKKYPRVLTIAGSDSGGGAGIQADIKSISATGSYAASAITAVTVQNTLGVEAVHPVPVETIAAQIKAVLSDIGAGAVKIGMLHSAEVVLAVRDALLQAEEQGWIQPAAGSGACNIVLDPVMVATSGHRLIEESAIKVLTEELLPLARVITPNIPEAEILIGRRILSQNDLPAAARELSRKASRCHSGPSCQDRSLVAPAPQDDKGAPSPQDGSGVPAPQDNRDVLVTPYCHPEQSEGSLRRPVSVLMKAGHLTDERLVDIFYNAEEDRIVELPSERVHTRNTHGTGCTLSSALASFLAQGLPLDDAARAATDYIHRAIVSGASYDIGGGHGPVNHFWRFSQPLDNQQ